jgi:hypothetical protein
VRHAAGELADGFHLLRMAKLLLEGNAFRLEAVALGDVDGEADQTGDAAGGVGEDAAQRAEAARAAVEARPVVEGDSAVVLRLRPQRVPPAVIPWYTPQSPQGQGTGVQGPGEQKAIFVSSKVINDTSQS